MSVHPVLKAVKAAASGFQDYMGKGAFQAIGMDPLTKVGSRTSWQFFNKRITTAPASNVWSKHGRLAPKIADNPGSMMDWIGSGGAMLGTAATMGYGYSEGGLTGALGMLALDVGVNAAIVKHGYKWGPKGLAVKRIGIKGGLPGMMVKFGMGTMFSIGASQMVGGGVPGFVAGTAAGTIGVKHGGKLALGYAGYRGASLAAQGTGSLLRAGRQFRQRQRGIQTSGDMAAFHTQGAQTMRARAVSAIHKSHLNARSALGQEANFLHYPSKNYHSRYRMG